MRTAKWFALALLIGILAGSAQAHFQVIMPDRDILARPGNVTLDIIFTHPMEQGPVMHMARPKQFGELYDGKKTSLLKSLVKREVSGKAAWSATYNIRRPGDHIFYIEPAPYWEPAEGKMIVHYTKVVVNAMGEQEGWDEFVGFPVEIAPLVRPYGIWAGNQFRGIVTKNRKPVPFAEIEVEYWNEGGKVKIPAEPFITQVIKADCNGVFSYTMPRAGWWAFAALIESDTKMRSPSGKMVPVELGALMWVKAEGMKTK